jgi:hypothetical protein
MKCPYSFLRITVPALAFLAFAAPAQADESSSAAAHGPSSYVWNRVNDRDASIAYSAKAGPCSDSSHDASAVGEWCKFSFTGTGVKWIGGKDNNHGTADVYLDGKRMATVDTTAPARLNLQELYVKTGLSDEPHLLMIQLKTSGYQDFDGFEYLAPPGALPAAKNLEHIFLPWQVPYLNTKQNYPLGNGVAMAVGEATGEWKQLNGPGYSSPNYISSEVLKLEVDGAEQTLPLEMKRARETGVFYGVANCGDLQVRLIDYGCWGQPWLSRFVMIDNLSGTTPHDVQVEALVKPGTATGITHWLVKDAQQNGSALAVKGDKTVNMGFAGMNHKDKAVVISFTDPATTASLNADTYTLKTALHHLAARGFYNVTLGHYFRQDNTPDSQCLHAIRAINGAGELGKSITDWQAWFEHVAPSYQLDRIKDERGRNIVEGALAILKTNQSQDGGFIANSVYFEEGYIRDAALGLRGLMATGHFDEAKKWLFWVSRKFAVFGHIPDSASCEPSLEDESDKLDCGDPNVEETALILLGARDYYHATKDLQTLNAVHGLLQYCMDVQIKEAIANGYKMDFNGDETEICGGIDVSSTGTFENDNDPKGNVYRNAKDRRGNIYPVDWSMSSVALCAASLDFYNEYLQLRGEDATAYHNAQTGTTQNLKTELAQLLKALDTDFWRTDVPELPGGFHDSYRIKSNKVWPLRRITNFTLMPVYFGTPYPKDEKAKDVDAMAHYFNEKTGFLQMVPGADDGFTGHSLGYLLWSLVEVGSSKKTEVYDALVNGPLPDCWGSFNETYDATGQGRDGLRTLETGCNVSALAKYWGLGP